MLEAQYIQATMYDQGLGVPKDNVKAITLYKLAAEHDHIKAQSKLGEIYVKLLRCCKYLLRKYDSTLSFRQLRRDFGLFLECWHSRIWV